MPSSYVTELALRAAANTNSRDLTDAGGQAETIKSVALQRATAGNNGSPMGPQASSLQAEAIGLAVAGIALAYTAISHQLGVLKNQRLAFDKEREAGIATFMIPTNKEERDLSKEEKVLKGYLDLVDRYPSFSKYLGIHSADLSTDTSGKFYSVLPFYRMSEALGQPVASTQPLDRQRTAINLFFKSALPDAIADIDISFQTDWKLLAFFKSAFQKKNYLNDRRAPRFIMMSLSNLLWNLQHPVDPETGFPLGLGRCIEICRDVELCLNQLLNHESPPYLQNINNDENELLSFMRKLEIYTKTLRAAYLEEQLHELNIDEITNSAHRALRIMDKSVFKLIYKRNNAITGKKEPDSNAAETLADTISYLNLLLRQNPELVNALCPVPAWISPMAGMNIPPQTTVDVLILCSHWSWRERNHQLEKLEKSKLASEVEFAKTLRKFDEKFVKPIKAVSKKEKNATSFFPQFEEVGRLTASRLMPFITLVIEDYRIEVDTPLTYQRAKSSQDSASVKIIYSGKQQAQAINLSAQAGGGYYAWALSPFTEGTAELDNLPKYQYRMTQVSKLMDSVSELVQNYRSFLLQKSFQAFLLKCLNKVKAENLDLDRRITDADSRLDHNERMSRSLQDILRPMMSDLNGSLDAFALAMANFELVVSAPDFTDQQRQLLSTKVGAIADQFAMLFAEDSGLAVLLDMVPTPATAPSLPHITPPSATDAVRVTPPVVHSAPTPPASVDVGLVLALRNLVQRCYDALSYQSHEGRKGLLLHELLGLIDKSPPTTERQVKHLVMELTRVAASSRETWFFQAGYGQSRSARALITAMKDPSINKVLPLASIIFEQDDINMAQVTEAQIYERLACLRYSNRRWQEPASKMRLRWPENGDSLHVRSTAA